MPRISGLVALLLIFTGMPALAADSNPLLAGLDRDRHHWQDVDGDMSTNAYRKASRNNQRLAKDSLVSYSKKAFTSIGVPEKGIALMGATIGLLADEQASFHLNRSKTMALEFKDIVSDDPAVFLGVTLEW